MEKKVKRTRNWLSVLGLIAITAFAQAALAVTCTVNNGLINPPDSAIKLNGAGGVPGLVIGVGKNKSTGATVAYVNGVASTLPAGTNKLNAVSVASSTYAVAVGDNGALVQYNGTTWSLMPITGTPPATDVLGVKTYGPNQTYAADKNGIYFFDGTTWSLQQTAPAGANFSGMWGNATALYGLADDGTVYTKVPATPPSVWTVTGACLSALAGNGAQFNGITGDTAGNIYVTGQDVGNNGFIYKYDPVANTCTNLYTSTVKMQLNGVAVNPANGAITAVGDKGAVVTVSSAGTLLSQTLPVKGVNNINGIYIAPAGTTYLAGQITAGCTSAATVTPAGGGGAIPSGTAGGAWTTLTGPIVTEANVGNIGAGTIILNVPAGFVFDIAGTAPTVKIAGDTVTAANNINNLASGTSAAITSISATQITFTVSLVSTGTVANTLTWQNIRVRPTATTPLASGNIAESGTATGFVAGTNFGTLTEVVMAGPDHIEIDHGGSALTCSPQTVTIKACANAACTTLYTAGGVNVTLTPGGLTFAIGVSGSNSAATVQQSTAGIATLAATSTPAALNATTCLNTVTGTASCAMTFNNSGFLVTVPNQVSCNTVSATIEAVQTAPGTGRCVPAYQSVTRAVNLYSSYVSPASGTQVVTASTGAVSTAAPGTAHNLVFDATGKATITLSYPDAGQLTLTATDTAPTGAAMTGSGTFIAAPASFAFSGIPAAPLIAGQPFNVTVTAKNACAAPTPNFNGTVTLASGNPLPGIGNATAINTALTGFASGVASTNLTWNEVGTIDLTASLSSYLGWTLPTAASGTQTGVGRFHPAYFDTAVTPACGTFTYAGSTTPAKAGQPFTVTVTAKAAGGIVTTANYAGAYAYPTTLSNAGVTAGFASNTIAAAGFANGAGSANAITYAVPVPQTAPLTLALRATDADPTPVSSAGHTEASTQISSGRVNMVNAYGSELLDLAVPLTAEYYAAGQGWTINQADSCTIATLPALTLQPGGTAVSKSLNSPFAGGKGNLVLTRPNIAGYVDMVANVPAWLQFVWSGTVPSSPAARATFGVYVGNSVFIYRGRHGR